MIIIILQAINILLAVSVLVVLVRFFQRQTRRPPSKTLHTLPKKYVLRKPKVFTDTEIWEEEQRKKS